MSRHDTRMLIIEDEDAIRTLLHNLFREQGYFVETAEDGHRGFQMATHNVYDVILTDLNMPDWDGITAINSLFMVMPQTKIVVYSGFLDQRTIDMLEPMPNVYGLLRKPQSIQKLCRAIDTVVNGTRLCEHD